MFFVPGRDDTTGNWLLGFEAGVDSGYAFLESSQDSLSPLEIRQGKAWKWLLDGKWVDQPALKMECVHDVERRQHLLSRSVTPFTPSDTSSPPLPHYKTEHFFKVEFFHPSNGALASAILFPSFPIHALSAGNVVNLPLTDFDFHGEQETSVQSNKDVLLSLNTMEWIVLSDVDVLMKFGHLHLIDTYLNTLYNADGASAKASSSASSSSSSSTYKLEQREYGILLNVEHGLERSWRVTYRVVNQYIPKRNTSLYQHAFHAAAAIPSSAFPQVDPASQEFFQTFLQGFGDADHPLNNPDAVEGMPMLPASDMYYDYYFPGKWSKVRDVTKINRVLALKEYRVDVSSEGVIGVNDEVQHPHQPLLDQHLFQITPLHPSAPPSSPPLSQTTTTSEVEVEVAVASDGGVKEESQKNDWVTWQEFYRDSLLPDLQIGDFLWLWYSTNTSSSTSSKVEELLVKLLYDQAGNHYLFEVYPTNRLDQMRQTMLQKNKDFLFIQRRNLTFPATNGENDVSSLLRARLAGRDVTIHAMIAVPKPHILRFLLNYILVKEKELNSLSACFFYHAAVTIPQALIYAAEILCTVVGSKPVVLIQYTSPSDHQWKFPLVQELSQALLLLHSLKAEVKKLPSPLTPHDRLIKSLNLETATFVYRADETLVFYHKDALPLVRALLPKNVTQALHPLPYELAEDASEAEKEKNWKEQIFNAAWNGLILGYPHYFIQRYCEEYHNPLTSEVKALMFEKALKRFHKFIEKTGFYEPNHHFKYLEKPEIQFGFHSPMNKFLLNLLIHRVTQAL